MSTRPESSAVKAALLKCRKAIQARETAAKRSPAEAVEAQKGVGVAFFEYCKALRTEHEDSFFTERKDEPPTYYFANLPYICERYNELDDNELSEQIVLAVFRLAESRRR